MIKRRSDYNICTYCLSKLINLGGTLQCTGDRLDIWVADFIRYEKMTSMEQEVHKSTMVNSDKFIDLYTKWSYLDENGNRPNFECEYTNQIYNPIPDSKVTIPDPLQVKRLEKALKRTLTTEELIGEQTVKLEHKEIKLKQLIFPDDF